MQLVIAEKPSVARSIAQVLGADRKEPGCLTGNGWVVSWCVGHLVELAMPEDYDPRYKKWNYADLPILPEHWKYAVSPDTKDQFEVLKKLMHDSRMEGVVCATDAGREGELIFRLVYSQAGCTLPVRRLWISSLEEEAIREGFRNLRDGHDYDSLYQAALCRERADWLVGMNASRLYSLLYGRTLKIGRVMTPTLSMIANREEAITEFKQEKFWTVQLTGGFTAQSERFSSREEAENLRQACKDRQAQITKIEQKEKAEKPPLLYDLTSLQRDANRTFGYTAQQTLDYTQSLYEKKLVTYPRTDSRFLTHDTADRLPDLIGIVSELSPDLKDKVGAVNVQQVIDDSKVSDHHAIIPTASFEAENIAALPAGERDILNLICVRLLCSVGEPFLSQETVVTLECGGHSFTAKGRSVRSPGWSAVRDAFLKTFSEKQEKKENTISPYLAEGQTIGPMNSALREGSTEAPKRYTEDTLLSAMENAGNEVIPEDAERRGIGTPATRAAILEKLISSGFLERKGSRKTKSLVPTQLGLALTEVVPEQIQSPVMTAEWEQRLKQIEHGECDPQEFLRDITEMLTELIKSARRVPDAEKLFPSGQESLGTCPACGANVTETPKGFFCENRTCRFGIWKDNRMLTGQGKKPTASMIKKLLKDGSVRLTGLVSQKTGRPYDAVLMLEMSDEAQPRLRLAFDNQTKKGKI